MKIVHMEQSNVSLNHMGGSPAYRLKEGKVECIITAWLPSKEDLKELNAGKPLIMQVYKEMPVSMLYTVNDEGKPNIT